jgi:hypothetical protein
LGVLPELNVIMLPRMTKPTPTANSTTKHLAMLRLQISTDGSTTSLILLKPPTTKLCCLAAPGPVMSRHAELAARSAAAQLFGSITQDVLLFQTGSRPTRPEPPRLPLRRRSAYSTSLPKRSPVPAMLPAHCGRYKKNLPADREAQGHDPEDSRGDDAGRRGRLCAVAIQSHSTSAMSIPF